MPHKVSSSSFDMPRASLGQNRFEAGFELPSSWSARGTGGRGGDTEVGGCFGVGVFFDKYFLVFFFTPHEEKQTSKNAQKNYGGNDMEFFSIFCKEFRHGLFFLNSTC
jgi:hypothetical protein